MKTTTALRLQAGWILYFNEVARCLSVREAARRLHVSPSAISRQIRELEDTLGAQLIERIPSGLRLTSAGETVAHHAAQLMSGLERMQESMDALRGLRRGHVRIAAVQAASSGLVPGIVAALTKRHPGLSFECSFHGSSTVLHKVLEGAADVGISFHSQSAPGLRHLIAVPLPFGAIVHPDDALATMEKLTLQDIAGLPLMLPDGSVSTRETVDLLTQGASLNLNTVVESNSPEFLVSAVRLGAGIAFQTPIGIERELEEGSLRFIPLVDRRLRPPELTVTVSTRTPGGPAASLVTEAVRSAVARLLA